MNKGIEETKRHYQRMMFKEALRTGFFEFQVWFQLCIAAVICVSAFDIFFILCSGSSSSSS